MIDELHKFVNKIEKFDELKASEKIDFFGLFFIEDMNYEYFVASDILLAFNMLRLEPYSNITQYLNFFSTKGKKQKFIKIKKGYHFIRNYDKILKENIKITESSFIDFKINSENINFTPSDIPLLNNNERKNAHFFTRLYFLFYHLENSIRNFIKKRLLSIVGSDWENEIISNVDLKKAQTIKKETDLSEMMTERGDNILHYCMWDDYGKIVKQFPKIFNTQIETDEIVAHLSSMTKIRNGIAHNSSTIPKEYQEELNVFLKKYIRILKKYN